ncbi:uncharacterized protein LOC100901559 [Galendromus occidentalis]|uniref:Uncharacterized protein LOC100901559 n=1 Tax=Galendromus occidentalis TaxID=34638 RepID=A0AAJ6VZU7_9ACAR|nr:uncharacterized protein LOC100901559 [Galendromus occidentalis]
MVSMTLKSGDFALFIVCSFLFLAQVVSSERSYQDQRFTARYDACNDRARFVLSPIDDGDCQVLCGPSSDSKLLRLPDQTLCKTNVENEQGICQNGRCISPPAVAEKTVTTRRPTGLRRSTIKFVPSTVLPVTSGFTNSWQKWRTYSPSTRSPLFKPDAVVMEPVKKQP